MRRPFIEPVANDLARTALSDVEELMAVQIDEPGDHHRRMLRSGPQEARLVQAERARRTQTFRIIDESVPRARAPPPSRYASRSRTRARLERRCRASLADSAADLDPSSARQRRPRG